MNNKDDNKTNNNNIEECKVFLWKENPDWVEYYEPGFHFFDGIYKTLRAWWYRRKARKDADRHRPV